MRVIPVAYTVTHQVVVRDDMTVDFELPDARMGKLHPVYATYWMTKHIELVSRLLILPFLEDDEEGIGFQVSVTHHASALPGMTLKLRAVHVRSVKNRVFAACTVMNELGDCVGEGKTTQVILKRGKLKNNFDALKARWESYRG